MSLSSQVSLGALRIQAQQRADLEYSSNITTPEWNQYISNSYKELYDMLISAYGNEYFVQTPYQFNTTSAYLYPLPSDFYKLLGVDLAYSASPTGYVTLQRFEFIERNKYAYPNTATTFSGYTNLKYRLMGNQLQLIPLPMAGQQIQVWYIQEPTPLQFFPICSTTASSQTVGVSDSTDLSVGMSIYGSGILTGTTITAINTTLNQITISQAATATQPVIALYCWTDAATMDGISGWEEYIIVDAAIKAGTKQETDVSGLEGQKLAMKQRIEAMAEGRDAGQAHHTSDALAVNGWQGFGGGFDGTGGFDF